MQPFLQTLKENARRVDRYGWASIWKPSLGFPIILAILLPAAGSWHYTGAWLFVLYNFIYMLVYTVLIVVFNPETLNRRGRFFQEGTKPFEFRFFVVWRVSSLITLLVAGLDVRFGWSQVSPTVIWASFGVAILSSLAGIWPILVNPHFEATVRIQKDRDHRVIDSGPYRCLRHPGYALSAPSLLAGALVLQSVWALLPSLAIVGAFLWRTAKEDRVLREELEGYREYAKRVRWKWLPGLW